MANEQVIKFFVPNKNGWNKETIKKCYHSFSDDCTPIVEKADIYNLKRAFGIPKQDVILFMRDTSFWNSRDQGCVITDYAFYIVPSNDNKDNRIVMPWSKIQDVGFSKGMFLFFDRQHELLVSPLYYNLFIKDSNDSGMRLAKFYTMIAQSVKEVDVMQLVDEGKVEEALELAEKEIKRDSNDCFPHMHKGYVYFRKGVDLIPEDTSTLDEDTNKEIWQYFDIALDEFNKALSWVPNEEVESRIYELKSKLFMWRGDNWNSRLETIRALGCCNDEKKQKMELQLNNLEENLSEVFDNYTQYDYKTRKFIMPIRDREIGGCGLADLDTFRMSNIPSCIHFPTGHPVPNELYVGHPYNPSLYVPYESSEEMFFLDKVHEMCYLLQCLGAEEITITSIKGRSVSEMENAGQNWSGSADVKAFSGDAEVTKNMARNADETHHSERAMQLVFDPTTKPFVPEGLIWYSEQPQWQRLVNSRISGNMLKYHEFVSTTDTKFVSSTEKEDIKSSAQYLWAKLNVNADQMVEREFKENVETKWEIDVKFRSIKELSEECPALEDKTELESSAPAGLTDQEQQYLEHLKEFLEDDEEITARERKMLDRIRQSLGISEERAKELEASLSPSLSEDEQEYLEMYRDYISEGEISEKTRKRLDKFASALGITEERVKQLEAMQ